MVKLPGHLSPFNRPERLREHLDSVLAGLLDSARLKLTAPTEFAGQLQLWLIDPVGMAAPLTERETSNVFARPPYWSFCWGSGLALARRILLNPAWVRGRTVVDFGCGSGVVAVAAALAGARRVIACDIDADALAATALNAAVNGVALEYLSDFRHLNEAVDTLFAADVLYDPENLPFLQAFRRCAGTVIVADSRVKQFKARGFTRFAQSLGVTVPDLGENEDVKQVRFYHCGAPRC